jgi:hypothetical protein
VIGVVERDGGTLYCSALFFSPEACLGKHRKLMPTAAERIVCGFGDGSTMPVFDTPLGRIGAVICWENYMPLLRMAMYARGVQIGCAPTADGRETWLSTMRHVALEGRCFVLSCNQFTRLPRLMIRAAVGVNRQDVGHRPVQGRLDANLPAELDNTAREPANLEPVAALKIVMHRGGHLRRHAIGELEPLLGIVLR